MLSKTLDVVDLKLPGCNSRSRNGSYLEITIRIVGQKRRLYVSTDTLVRVVEIERSDEIIDSKDWQTQATKTPPKVEKYVLYLITMPYQQGSKSVQSRLRC